MKPRSLKRAAISHNAGGWAKFERPKKRLRFLRAVEFGRARMAEQGLRPAARAGEIPRSRRGAAVTSVHALVICRRAPGKAPTVILICRKRIVGIRSNLIVL